MRLGILVLCGLSWMGCEEKKSDPAPKPAASAMPVAPKSAETSIPIPSALANAAPVASETAPSPAAMLVHCPNAVVGAKTTYKDTKDGLEMLVTAAGGDVQDIRARAKFMAEEAKKGDTAHHHNSSGGGQGGLGRCPVVIRDTTVEVSDVEGGSKIVITPKNAKEADWLRRESRGRLEDMSQPGGKEAGQGHMAHCPSSVKGAKTTSKETKDGVELTIVGADDASSKEILTRAKFLVEAAKKDPTTVKHNTGGGGGGSTGRCPVVLKDTTVEVKDTKGGALVVVKPVNAKDLPALKTEIKERLSRDH